MSVMFRKALSKHIEQLTHRLEAPASASSDKELAKIEELLQLASDGRFKRSLMSQKARILAGGGNRSTDTGDVRRRLDLLRKLYVELKDHPEYGAGRRGRLPGPRRRKPD
jgi:hypothetical protein